MVQTRTAHYDNRLHFERGVLEMVRLGWRVEKIRTLPGKASEVVFVRSAGSNKPDSNREPKSLVTGDTAR